MVNVVGMADAEFFAQDIEFPKGRRRERQGAGDRLGIVTGHRHRAAGFGLIVAQREDRLLPTQVFHNGLADAVQRLRQGQAEAQLAAQFEHTSTLCHLLPLAFVEAGVFYGRGCLGRDSRHQVRLFSRELPALIDLIQCHQPDNLFFADQWGDEHALDAKRLDPVPGQ